MRGCRLSVFFCGFIGHSDKNCLLPEEEKRVRFCLEQKASPYRDSEHRSFYLPAEPANVKRHLQFLSKSSADWKITGGAASQEYDRERAERRKADVDSGDIGKSANPADVLQMVAAVENLQVTEGKTAENNLVITAAEVTAAANNILQQSKWTRVYKKKSREMKGGQIEDDGKGSRGSPMGVPPIEECLRSDGSLLKELRADANRTASAFRKAQDKILRKRTGCNDLLMKEGDQNIEDHLGGRA